MHRKMFLPFYIQNMHRMPSDKSSQSKDVGRHYMRKWRHERLNISGDTTNTEITPASVEAIPETTNHIPEIHSSLLQSDILK